MTRSAALTRRLSSLQAVQHERRLTHLTKQIADRLGIDPEDVRREADELVRHWAKIGATTNEAKLADVASELRISPDELLARLRQIH